MMKRHYTDLENLNSRQYTVRCAYHFGRYPTDSISAHELGHYGNGPTRHHPSFLRSVASPSALLQRRCSPTSCNEQLNNPCSAQRASARHNLRTASCSTKGGGQSRLDIRPCHHRRHERASEAAVCGNYRFLDMSVVDQSVVSDVLSTAVFQSVRIHAMVVGCGCYLCGDICCQYTRKLLGMSAVE